MSEQPPARERHRVEDHYVYALLAIPIFVVTLLIISLIAVFGASGR